MIEFQLPWPPSANTYWRRNGSRYFVCPKGMEYRKLAAYQLHHFKDSFCIFQRLSISIEAYPPDKRRRDLDNIFKCLMDSLQYASVFEDDCQIDRINIMRMQSKIGMVNIQIEELN
jgi:crossover junction endodeoxyribonuclease RusA